GLKAASMAPTWPTINGEWRPATLFNKNVEGNYVNNPIMVHFIHRGLAYLLVILLTIWFIMAGNSPAHSLIYRKRWLPFLIALTQVVLGILTVLYSYDAKALLWFGVLHQFTAMILVMVLVWALYITRGQKVISV